MFMKTLKSLKVKRFVAAALLCLTLSFVAPLTGEAAVYQFEGQLTNFSQLNNAEGTGGKYFQTHKFKMRAGVRYDIDLISKDFDSYLMLINPVGAIVAQDDDGGEGLDARLSFTPKQSGTFKVVVTTFNPGKTGSYRGAVAENDFPKRKRVIQPIVPINNNYYSPKLQANFVMTTINWNGIQYQAARLTSQPTFGSPLAALSLNAGDVITRLDNISVTNLAELENHHSYTTVRYIRLQSNLVQEGRVFVPVSFPLPNPFGPLVP